MQTKHAPPLRFPGFSEDWREVRLGDISEKVGSGSTPRGGERTYQPSGILFIRSQNVNDDELKLDDIVFISEQVNQQMRGSVVQANDILLNITGASIGRSCVVPDPFEGGNVNQHVCIVRLSGENDPRFLQAFLSSSKGHKLITKGQTGSGREGLNFQSIRSFQIAMPNITEQQKIAAFLSAVNEKIGHLTTKKKLLLEYKKGVMQQVFDQKIRFKDDNGNDFPDWESTELNQISQRVKQKNRSNEITLVLTNSATMGIVSQSDYFDKDIANPNNLSGYYVVDTDDFVYNPRISTAAPVGPIKRNTGAKGVMSPLYIVFRLRDVNFDFFEYLFETSIWHDHMRSIANFGVRHDRMNITTEGFFEMPVLVPSLGEQEKISSFLRALDNKIDVVDQQLEGTKSFKNGLLQQMFV